MTDSRPIVVEAMRRLALGSTLVWFLVSCQATSSPPVAGDAHRSTAQQARSESAGAPDRAAAPDESSTEAAASGGPTRRELTMVDGSPFGCELLPMHVRSVQRYLDPEHSRFDEEGRLPMRLFRHLRPSVDRLRVLGPGGACEPRLGQVSQRDTPTSVRIVAQAMGGCGTEHSSFAFASCEVPEWLRYRRLVSTIAHQPRRGPLDDPMLQALIPAEPEFVAATEGETPRERSARLRRRSRRSVIRTEREELLVLELHRFLEGSHPCAGDEDVARSIQVRSVDGDTPGPWQTLQTRGRVVGAYLDEHGFIIALDTRPPLGTNYHCAHEGWDCNIMAIEGRSSAEAAVPLATCDFLFGSNWLSHESDSRMLHRLNCDQSGY